MLVKNRIFMAAFLIALVCALLVSCVGAPEKSGAETFSDSDVEAIPESSAESTATEPGPLPKVTFVREEREELDDSGKIQYFYGNIIYPIVSLPENPTAEKAIKEYFDKAKEEYLSYSETVISESKALLEQVETGYWNTFFFSREYRLERLGGDYLSFVCADTVYLGGVHPSTEEMGVVFDMRDGHRVTLTEIAPKTEAFSEVCSQMISDLISESDLSDFGVDAEGARTLISDDTFYLSDDGVTFICNTYVLFPYVVGQKYYTVPYYLVSGMLSCDIKAGAEFAKFYSFDLDGEDSEDVLGYLDSREFYCPYEGTEKYQAYENGVYLGYIIPKRQGSTVTVERIEYDEDGKEVGVTQLARFEDTERDFCLELVGEPTESLPRYRVTVEYGAESGSIDVLYSSKSEAPVKLIK